MLVSNYFVHICHNGDGEISFQENGVTKKVVIPKCNIIAIEIFHAYYKQLKSFKNRHYAIAKWIVRDIRKAGFDFMLYKDSKTIFKPIRRGSNGAAGLYPGLTKEGQLHWLLLELNLINQKLYYNSLENEH